MPKYFALIIDSEVAANLVMPTFAVDYQDAHQFHVGKLIAALSSSPIVIATNEKIEEGSIWDGKKFLPPVE